MGKVYNSNMLRVCLNFKHFGMCFKFLVFGGSVRPGIFRGTEQMLGAQPTWPMYLKNFRVPPPSTSPNSSSGRASTSGAGVRGFDTRSRHTKGIKMIPVATLLGAQHYNVSTGSLFSHSLLKQLTLHNN